MDVVLQRNLDGTWASGNGGRGFVQRSNATTQQPRRHCAGLTRLLRRSYRAGAHSPLSPAWRGDGWRAQASSRAQGQHVHRVLMHEIMCAARGCQCARAGGIIPASARGSFADGCVRAARAFAADHALRPLAGELVVLHPRWPIGTRLDAVYYDHAGRLVLVSWKSGRGAQDERERHLHRVQAACERALLHLCGARIHRTVVVQLGVAQKSNGRAAAFYTCDWLLDAHCEQLYADLERRLQRRFAKK